MSELVVDQQQSSIQRKFYWFWIFAGAIGWPVCWAAVALGKVPAGIVAVVVVFLVPIFEPKKPAQSTDWFRLSLIGLYGGFEFSWNTGNGNPIDLMALAVLGSLGTVAYYALVILVIAGPIWLFLAFASLICPFERAKWRSLLFPVSAKSLVIKGFLYTGILVIVVVAGGVFGSLAHRLDGILGWSMTGTEFNLAMRFVFGLTGGVIISSVGQRLINLISRRIHRSTSLAR